MRLDRISRWLVLGGVVGPIVLCVDFTVAGLIRPGYSPIHQAISDLGIGSNGWLLNVSAVISGLLLVVFAVGFSLSMRAVLSRGWRWLSAILLALHGLGFAIAGTFTEAPATLAIHWLVGANLGFFGPVLAFLVVGLALRRDAQWRAWSSYTIVACLVTMMLVGVTFWVFTPGTTLASAHLGGLMERLSVVEIEAWYVVVGWRLFVLAGSRPGAEASVVERQRVPMAATDNQRTA
jgi:hypothetical membrane protein